MKDTANKNKLMIFIGMFLMMFQGLTYGQGSSYAGSYTASAPISWSGVSNQTISKLQITNPSGHCISLNNCSNITIQFCKLGPSKGEGVYLSNCTNITIVNCSMSYIETGVYAVSSTGIKVNYNDVQNVQGPFPRGQLAQFNGVSGGGNSISYNVGENIAGQSNPEDEINLYKSNGIATDPIQITGNWIRGGGPSTSGGGIMTGDAGGSYVLVQNNILVDPGQYGISVASGTNMTVSSNQIYACCQSFCNVGLYAWNQYTTPCSAVTIQNNQVNYTKSNGTLNNFWNGGNCGTITGWSTNVYNAGLSASILPTKIIGRAASTTTEVTAPTVNPETGSKGFKVYPNPATDHISIESSPDMNRGTVIIYNIKGQRIIEQTLMPGSMDIDTRMLAKGVYLMTLSGENQATEQKKIIVQ